MAAEKVILIVDDDEEFALSNKDMLEILGYTVYVEHNGENGLKTASEKIPDLILLDIMMTHDTEGIDVARKIKTIPELKSTKIIIISGIVAEKKLKNPLEPDSLWLPVDRFLEKPIEPRKLISEIEKILG